MFSQEFCMRKLIMKSRTPPGVPGGVINDAHDDHAGESYRPVPARGMGSSGSPAGGLKSLCPPMVGAVLFPLSACS
jgi:hypothetical protein